MCASAEGGPGLKDASRPDRRFPRRHRLLNSPLFAEAFSQSEGLRGRYLVLWLRRGEGASRRVGVVASRRTFPRSVDRARAKRLLREAFRLNRDQLCGSWDAVLLARRQILDVKRQAVDGDLMRVAGRAGIRLPAPGTEEQ